MDRRWSLVLGMAAGLWACESGKVGSLEGDDGTTAQTGDPDTGVATGEGDLSGTGTDDTGSDGDGSGGGSGDGGSGAGDSGGSGDSGDAGGEAGGDAGDGGGDAGGDDGSAATPVDTRDPGASSVSTSTDSLSVDDDCTMDLTLFEPSGAAVGTVILSHGFIRSGANVVGWGEHMASHGLRVVVPELCHLSFRDTDHAANGEELALLADALGYGPVAYVGHSAGGLASALALTHDASAVGGVGLDPVDADNLGRDASFSAAFHGLFGESGSCNSGNNGVDMVNGTALGVAEAGHCDFESPKDSICDFACGQNNPTFSDDELQETIRALSTAAVLGFYGDTATADAWWTAGGSYYDGLASSGAIDRM